MNLTVLVSVTVEAESREAAQLAANTVFDCISFTDDTVAGMNAGFALGRTPIRVLNVGMDVELPIDITEA